MFEISKLSRPTLTQNQKSNKHILFLNEGFHQTNEMVTSYQHSVFTALLKSGTVSYIVWLWEILQPFFDNYNVSPVWIRGNYTFEFFDKESAEWTPGGLIITVRFTIKKGQSLFKALFNIHSMIHLLVIFNNHGFFDHQI